MLNNDTRPKRKTLLDLNRLPTKKELRSFFLKNDWSTAKPYDFSKMEGEEAEDALYVKDVFNGLWDQSAKRHGQKSPPCCFTKDYPPEVLKNAIGDIVSGKVTEIANDDEQLETILTPFFEDIDVIEKAEPFVNNAFDRLLDTVGYEQLIGVTKKIGAKEDVSNLPVNYPRTDFENKWDHKKAKTKVIYSSKLVDEELKKEYHDPVESVEDKMFVEGFFKLLDPTDVEILKMTFAGYTRQQIAEKLGFQTHSAVTKRLHKLKSLYLKYFGEEK